MAYAAMNIETAMRAGEIVFLNGVCRHEQRVYVPSIDPEFLNGVCRHEH